MQKKGLIFVLSIFLINFVSAFSHYGYGRFSFTDLLNRTDPQIVTLTILFLIFFSLIFLVLMRFSLFKNPYGEPHRGIAGVIALGASALITYWMYIRGFDLSGIFLDIGLSSDSLYGIFPILFLILAILLIWKTSFKMFLFLMGVLLILLTIFTDIFYSEGLVTAIGLVLLILAWWLRKRSRGGGMGMASAGEFVRDKYDWEKEKRQAKYIGGKTLSAGKGVARQTFGRTGFAKGRLMHPKRAEEEAYREEAERNRIKFEKSQIEAQKLDVERDKAIRKEEEENKKEKDMKRQQKEAKRQQKERIKAEGRERKEQQRARDGQLRQDIQRENDQKQELERQEDRENKFALARKIGIDKLEKEFQRLSEEHQEGIQNAGELHSTATRLGWTKAGIKPRAGENEKEHKRRAKEASDAYKKWYRQYSRNIQIEKKIKEIQERISHLQERLG